MVSHLVIASSIATKQSSASAQSPLRRLWIAAPLRGLH
jgi:hypothetical protein